MYAEVYGCLGFSPFGTAPVTFGGFDSVASVGHIFPSIMHKDAFLLFRALCKLSMKGLQDDTSVLADPMALQNKYVYASYMGSYISDMLMEYFVNYFIL